MKYFIIILLGLLLISGCSLTPKYSDQPYNLINPQGPGFESDIVSLRWLNRQWLEVEYQLKRIQQNHNWHLKGWEPIYVAMWDNQDDLITHSPILLGTLTIDDNGLTGNISVLSQTMPFKVPMNANKISLILGDTSIKTAQVLLPARP